MYEKIIFYAHLSHNFKVLNLCTFWRNFEPQIRLGERSGTFEDSAFIVINKELLTWVSKFLYIYDCILY